MPLWRAVLLVPALMWVLPLSAAPADTTREADVPRVSIEFTKVEIREAMRQLGEKTHIDFIITPGVQGNITAKFIDERLDKVLKVIALAMGCEVRLVEGVFVLRKPGEAKTGTEVPGAAAPAATEPAAGAGALLPGTAPTTPLPEAGGNKPLVGTPGETPPAAAPATGASGAGGTKRENITLKYRTAGEVAAMLGGGYVDYQGRYHPPGQATAIGPTAPATSATVDPYRNLPPGARVSRNGTIMLPNGTTILPSGVIIAPNGTVYQRQQQPTVFTVPYGTTPQSLQNQWNQYLQQQQGYNPNSAVVGPTQIKIGPATVTLPGVQIGANGQTQQVPAIAPTAPNAAKGSGWHYGLPPNWHYVPPNSQE